MDVVSQALVGAATALTAARPQETRIAALVGAVAGVLPDADVVIQSAEDPLLNLEYHRHFSHALIFIPVGALLAAALLWPLLRKSLPFARLYLFSLLGIALAAVLDACTSYGTHLLWPFSETRTAWSIVSVFDPVFTLLVGVPVMFALWRMRPTLGGVGLTLCALYLGLAGIQHQRAFQLMETYAAQGSLQAERVLVKPSFGNIVLWRGIVQTSNHIHVAGIRPGIFGEHRVYPGERAERFVVEDIDSLPNDSRLRDDLERFAFFSDNLLVHSPTDANRIGDARYAMRPDSLKPMWSVRFDPAKLEQGVKLMTDRVMSTEDRTTFLDMLMGRP